MLNTSRLMGFVASARPEESKRFYVGVLGLRVVEDTPFALILDANGNTVRVQKVKSVSVPAYTVLGWEVADITDTARRLRDKGVLFQCYDGLPQDEFGIWTTPDGNKVAWFKDPDGNILSLTENGT